jgi:hypothetical protein
MLVADDAVRTVQANVLVVRAAEVRQFGVTEEALVGGVIDIALPIIEPPPVDTQRVQLVSLVTIVEPEDTVGVRKTRKHKIANDIIVSLDLGDHIIRDENNDVPGVVNAVHVRIARLNLGSVVRIEDPTPGDPTKHPFQLITDKIPSHGLVIVVAGHRDPEKLGMVGVPDVRLERLHDSLGARTGWALEKNTHWSFLVHRLKMYTC